MTYRIVFKILQVNTCAGNAAVVVGDARVTGWDGSLKNNTGQGAVYGHYNWELANVNLNLDDDIWVDGLMNDADWKPSWRVFP